MLRSLDLFTGIGGLTHALRGLASPVAYCEINPGAQAALRSLMARGLLPTAPIHPDIATLRGQPLVDAIDIIVAGWPCVGFSSGGLRRGFSDSQSGLFRELVRVIGQVRPPFLFMENVAPLVSVGKGRDDIRGVVKLLCPLGYDLWWVTLPAHAVGAPQTRLRWYCLGVRRGPPPGLPQGAPPGLPQGAPGAQNFKYHKFEWTRKTEPRQRMVPRPTPCVRQQLSLLGNSVVPDAARAAFCLLWTGCRLPLREALAGPVTELPPKKPEAGRALTESDSPFLFACALGWGPGARVRAKARTKAGAKAEPAVVIRAIPSPQGLQPRKDWGLSFDPRAYLRPAGGPPARDLTSGTVTTVQRRQSWATPRASAGPTCNGARTLTNRGMRDLATQLRFERRTPRSQRGGATSPQWAAWLMGYPRGWLRECAD